MLASALEGFRVIDLTSRVAGPFCTKMLASFGAEVIKIEQPGAGDEARRLGPFIDDEPHPEKSGTFLYLNTGKKSVTLDISTATGRELFLQLVRNADALVESFLPNTMAGWGLGYEALASVNPRLVVTSVTDFGQNGPYRDYRAEDIVASAYGGLLYCTGDPDREPLKSGGQPMLYVTGLNAFLGTLTAAMARRLTGRGQHIDISAMETVASLLEHGPTIWSYCFEQNTRTGNLYLGQAAWGTYAVNDGYVVVCSGGRGRFTRYHELMNDPRLRDARFASGAGRQKHQEEIDELMKPWLESHDKEEIYHSAQRLRMPFGCVRTTEDVVKSDQLKAQDFFVDIEHPATGVLSYPGGSIMMSETPLKHGRAPLLGEHNEEILCGRLGLSRLDLVRLRQTGVI